MDTSWQIYKRFALAGTVISFYKADLMQPSNNFAETHLFASHFSDLFSLRTSGFLTWQGVWNGRTQRRSPKWWPVETSKNRPFLPLPSTLIQNFAWVFFWAATMRAQAFKVTIRHQTYHFSRSQTSKELRKHQKSPSVKGRASSLT